MRFKLDVVGKGLWPGYTVVRVVDTVGGGCFYDGLDFGFAVKLRETLEPIDWTGLLVESP